MLRGELALGTWQAIYLVEHRARPHRREIVLQFIGAMRHLKRKPAADRSAAGLLSCRYPAWPDYFVMSTSLVSGRKKKPTTAVIDAKMIGYQRPA